MVFWAVKINVGGIFGVWCSKIIELGFNEKFVRTWEYYFDYCAAGFKTRTLGDYQVPLYTITLSFCL